MKVKKMPKKLKILPIIIAAITVIIIALVILLVTILRQNYIVYQNVKKSGEATDNDVNTANIIIVDNIIIGGHSNGKWIDSKTIYDKYNGKSNIGIDMYSQMEKYGRYDTASFRYNKKANIVYTTTTRVPSPERYIALSDAGNDITPYLKKVDCEELDVKNVKSAMGKYRFLNNSVKVISAYDVFVEKNISGRIIVAASDSNLFGVYSAVIYVGSNGPQLVKYAYVKKSEKSVSWPIYAVDFALDIDGDSIAEIVLQETTETTTAYTIMKYENNIFKEVLKQTINL